MLNLNTNKKIRIAKFIAKSGLCSRRDAEIKVLNGEVSVDGELITSPALNVSNQSVVIVDGERIRYQDVTELYLYYKPKGLLVTKKDEKQRMTIFDDLPKSFNGLFSVGRLDKDSSGLLLLTNAAGDNDLDFLQLVKEGFKYEAGKQLAFNIRFKTSDATQTDIVAGLQLTDTTPLDVTDGVFFLKEDGSTSISFIVEKDSTQSTLTLPNALADDTFMTLGFVFDPKDQKFHVFQDNVLAGTVVNTNAPDDEELTVSFGVQNGEAVAKTMTIDYVGAMKERTANAEL